MSDTVKLIIEIPEVDYLAFSELSEKEKANELSYYERIIANGIPLDDVKAEIQAKEMVETDVARQFYNMALADAIQILDNIGKESEVKPNEKAN